MAKWKKDNLIDEILKSSGFSEEEIADKKYIVNLLKGWKAITLRELESMNKEELSTLLSVCWHEGAHRCDTIGISNVQIEYKKDYIILNYSDMNGDPTVCLRSPDELIDKEGDGDWDYGLYKKVKHFNPKTKTK